MQFWVGPLDQSRQILGYDQLKKSPCILADVMWLITPTLESSRGDKDKDGAPERPNTCYIFGKQRILSSQPVHTYQDRPEQTISVSSLSLRTYLDSRICVVVYFR